MPRLINVYVVCCMQYNSYSPYPDEIFEGVFPSMKEAEDFALKEGATHDIPLETDPNRGQHDDFYRILTCQINQSV